MTTLSPAPKAQFFDANGAPLSGGKLYSYAAGSTTPLVTYTSASGGSSNTNPVILDSRGEANVWLGNSPYKLVLKDSTDVEIWTVDNIYRTATVEDTNNILPVLAASGGSALIGFIQAGTSAVASTVQTKLREAISITDFGASPSATAAINSAAITAAINALPATGGKLYIPYGTYSIKGQQHIFSSKTKFLVEGNNATLKVADAEPVVGATDIFYFTACVDGIIQNITLDGNRANRVPAEVQANCVTVWSNCARLKFLNVNAINAVNDGYYIVAANADKANQAAYPTDISFINCVARNAHRNGLSSICSLRLTIQGGSYSGSTGTAPQAGIGFEPDAGYTYANSYVSVSDVDLYNNVGYGMYTGGPTTNTYISFKNIRGNSNGEGLIQLASAQYSMLDGIYVGPHTTLYRGAIDVNSSTKTQITNVSLYGISDSTNAHGIFVQSDTDDVQISGVRASTLACNVIYTNAGINIDDVVATDLTGNGIVLGAGATPVVRNVSIAGCSGVAIFADAADDVVLENITLVNIASTTAAIYFASTSDRPVVKNINIYQNNGIPSGAVGIYFGSAPRIINGVYAYAPSPYTNFTYANIFTFAGGFSYSDPNRTWLTNCRPTPLFAAPDINPASLSAGATATATVTFSNPAITGTVISFGDDLTVSPGVDLAGLILTSTISANDTVRYTLYNPTAGAIDLANATWLFTVEKKPV